MSWTLLNQKSALLVLVINLLSNCNYDKVKLLYKVSKMVGFLEKHAINDSQKDKHAKCGEIYKELKVDLEKHLNNLKIATEMISK